MSGCIGIQTLQTSFFSVKKRFIGLKGKSHVEPGITFDRNTRIGKERNSGGACVISCSEGRKARFSARNYFRQYFCGSVIDQTYGNMADSSLELLSTLSLELETEGGFSNTASGLDVAGAWSSRLSLKHGNY
ncbi:MAG: hypothetical protein J2P37_26440 [Ktedonobacteraceae bacterium]|nr:hypothetical protein [Ktedonobacteraceae bacterium]MBO0794069.1 hypothetical protein [Ktedonobacteraceae bacterium]